MARRKPKLRQPDTEIDMTPMIDMVFLLIIFFILAGKITAEITSEQITVPPTKTAEKQNTPDGWTTVKIEVYGTTQQDVSGMVPYNVIKMGYNRWEQKGLDDFSGYAGLRAALDDLYNTVDKYPDPTPGSPMQLPKVILEIRADADTEYRVIQEIQQVVSDSVQPDPVAKTMLPKAHPTPAAAKPFVNLTFTTRFPGD